jgi:hypothetical protein
MELKKQFLWKNCGYNITYGIMSSIVINDVFIIKVNSLIKSNS